MSWFSISKEEYDVRGVRHRGLLAAIGRWIGGCAICGALTDIHVQCVRGGGHICPDCRQKYIEYWLTDGSYMMPENPDHPYHGRIR